jgi:hypothetical protein
MLAGAVEVALAPKAGLTDIADLEQFHLPFAGSGINVERNWLRANRAATARFVKSAAEAVALMKRDRDVFNAAIAKWMNIRDPQAQASMYAAAMEFPVKSYPSVEGIQTIMDIYDGPEMRAHKVTDFYDSSLVAELDRAGTLDALYR